MAKKSKGGSKYDSMKSRVREQAKISSTHGSSTLKLPEGVQMYKPQKGTAKLDFIPYVVSDENHGDSKAKVGQLWYRKPIKMHFNIGVDQKAVICPRTIGKKCPICTYAAELKKSGDDDAAKELKPKDRELYNVIDLNNKDAGIQVFEMSKHNFGTFLEEEINAAEDDDPIVSFADLIEGSTLKVRFSDATMGTNKFLKASRIDCVERKKPYGDEIVDEAVDFDNALVVLDYEKLESMFLEMDDAKDKDADDDDDDEKPKKGKGKKKDDDDDEEEEKPRRGRKPSKDDDDDEDDDEPKSRKRGRPVKESDDDDEEEDEKPKAKKRGRPAKEEDDDDDDDEETKPVKKGKGKSRPKDDDDEDEEEEKPKRGRPSKKSSDDDDDDEEEEKPKTKGKKKGGDDECPEGFEFGVDTDTEDACEDCDLWKKCSKAKDEADSGGKKKRR